MCVGDNLNEFNIDPQKRVGTPKWLNQKYSWLTMKLRPVNYFQGSYPIRDL